MKSKNAKVSNFWKIYLTVVITVIVLICIGLAYLWHVMGLYEQSTPAYAMQSIESVYNKDQYVLLAQNAGIEDNIYESNDARSELFHTQLSSGELKSKRLAKGSTDTEQNYQVKAGDEVIGSFKLVFVDEGMFGHWQITHPQITPKMWGNLTITIPASAQLSVNGIPCESSAITQTDIPFELLEKLPDDIVTPVQTRYEIRNLMAAPTVNVTDENGNALNVSITNESVQMASAQQDETALDTYTAKVDLSHKGENAEDLKAMALSDAENYSRFLSNDNKFSQIAPRLLGGSQIYADLSIMETMFYTPHTRVSFTEPVADNIIHYTDNIFSIDANYNYTVYRGEDRPYVFDTNITLVYVKHNDIWRIADIKILS